MRKLQTMRSGVRPQPHLRDDTPPSAQSDDVADYLADVAHQLAQLAATARLERVGYLLSLAAQEATLSRPRRSRRSHDEF